MVTRAEGEEFLLRTVLAVDQKDLVRGDIEGLPDVFEECGFGRLQPVVQKFGGVAVGKIAAGQKVERAFGVAGVHPLQPVDAQIGDEGAARGEGMAQVGGPSGGFVDRLGPTDTPAEADEDHVRAAVGLALGKRGKGGGKASGKPEAAKGEAAAVHNASELVNSLNIA